MTKEKCEKETTSDTFCQLNYRSQQEKEAYAQERLKSKSSHIEYRVMVMNKKVALKR